MLIGGAYSIVKGSKNVVKADEKLKESNVNSNAIAKSNAELERKEHSLNNKNGSDGVGVAGNKTGKAALDRVGKKSSEVTSDITRIDKPTSNTNIKHNGNSSNDGIVVAGGSEVSKKEKTILTQQDTQNLFNRDIKEINIGGYNLKEVGTNKDYARILDSKALKSSDLQQAVKQYVSDLTGIDIKIIEHIKPASTKTGNGIRYTIPTEYGNINIRNYSTSTLTDGTKPRWTIDIPMEFVGKNGKKIFMKLNLNRKFL